MKPNGPGPVTALDDAMIERIVEAIPKVLVLRHVANLNHLPDTTLITWLKRGNLELREGRPESIYTKLSRKYYAKRSEVLEEKLLHLATCPKNYGAITWILEKCFRDDFETKSDAHKQLEDLVLNYLKPIMERGGLDHVRERLEEIHSEGDQA